MLGEELQYVLVLLPLAWFVDNNALLRQFLLLTYVSCYANNAAKEVLQLPRPPIGLHVNVGQPGHDGLAAQYGFPSTHCALAVAFSWLCGTKVYAAAAMATGADQPATEWDRVRRCLWELTWAQCCPAEPSAIQPGASQPSPAQYSRPGAAQ